MRSRSRGGGGSALSSAVVPLALALTLSACHAAPRPATTPRVPPIVQLQHDLDALLEAPALERGYWGVLVRSLAGDETLYAVNARRLLMPASTLKIVTLAAAAETLGWDYSYQTELVAGGPVEAGVLRGDLLVVGSGDPSIGGRDGPADRVFEGWAGQLKALGIQRIDGRIVGDDRAFDHDRLGPGWSWDDLSEGYAAGVAALQFNENAVAVTVAPGAREGDPALVTIAPDGSGLMVRSAIRTAGPASAPSVQVRRLPGSVQVEFRGSVPIDGAPVVRTLSVDNPTLFFVTALRHALVAHGITVGGAPVGIDEIPDAPPRGEAKPLLTHRSPPLSSLAAVLMKVSQNLYAETLLRTLGAVSGAATVDGGRSTARATLERWGVTPSGLLMIDGSGLSRYNLVTPETLVSILTHVERDETLRGPFEAALPIAGRDGTLAQRMKGTEAEANARAKTGSMANVRGLAGYLRTADGEPIVFAILANNFETPPDVIDRASDAIVVRLARFSRRF